jgi:hypothetical protein
LKIRGIIDSYLIRKNCVRDSPTLAQPGRASGCSGWPAANRHSAYQAYRNRVVAGSNPARGTIINFRKSFIKYKTVSDDKNYSTLDKNDNKEFQAIIQLG